MAIPREILGRLNAKEPEVAPADLKTIIERLEELKQLNKGKFFEKFKTYLLSRRLPPGIQQLVIQADAGLAAECLADISPNNQAQFCRDRNNDEHRLTLFKRLHSFKEINPLVVFPFIKHQKTTPLMAGLVLNRIETADEATEIVKRFPDCVKYSTHPLDLPKEAKEIVLKHDPDLKIYLSGVLPEVEIEVKKQPAGHEPELDTKKNSNPAQTPILPPTPTPNTNPNSEVKKSRGRPPKAKETPLPVVDEPVVLDLPTQEDKKEVKTDTPKRRGRPPKPKLVEQKVDLDLGSDSDPDPDPDPEHDPEQELKPEPNIEPQSVTPEADTVVDLPVQSPELDSNPNPEPDSTQKEAIEELGEEDEEDDVFIIPDFDNEPGSELPSSSDEQESEAELEPGSETEEDDEIQELDEEDAEDELVDQRFNPQGSELDNADAVEEPGTAPELEEDDELSDDIFDEKEESETEEDESEPELDDADLDTEELFDDQEEEERPNLNQTELVNETDQDSENEDDDLMIENDFFNDEEDDEPNSDFEEEHELEAEPEPEPEVKPEKQTQEQPEPEKQAKQVQNKVNIDDTEQQEQRPVSQAPTENPLSVDLDDEDLFVEEDLTDEEEADDWSGRPLSADDEDESALDRRLAPSQTAKTIDEDDIEWIENILGEEGSDFSHGDLGIDPDDAQNVPGKENRVIHKKTNKIDDDDEDLAQEFIENNEGGKKIDWSEYQAETDEDENPRANSRPIPQSKSEYEGRIETDERVVSPLNPDEERDCVNLIKLIARRMLEDERVMKKFKGKISKDELTRYLVKRDAMNRFLDKRKLSGNYKGLPDKFLKLPYQVKVDLVDTAFPAEIIKFKTEASGGLTKIKRALAVELRNPGNAFNQIKTVLRQHRAVLKQAKIDEYRSTSGLSQAYYGSFYFKNPSELCYFYVDKKLHNVEVSRHPID